MVQIGVLCSTVMLKLLFVESQRRSWLLLLLLGILLRAYLMKDFLFCDVGT